MPTICYTSPWQAGASATATLARPTASLPLPRSGKEKRGRRTRPLHRRPPSRRGLRTCVKEMREGGVAGAPARPPAPPPAAPPYGGETGAFLGLAFSSAVIFS